MAATFTHALKAGLILGFIGVVSIAGVLTVQHQTAELIAHNHAAHMQKLQGQLLPSQLLGQSKMDCRELSDPRIGKKMPVYLTYAADGTLQGLIMVYATALGYSNPLVLIAGMDDSFTLHAVDIYLSKETPGLGDKVDRRHGNFLDQFHGRSLNTANFEVTKFGGDFDYITGATVTSRAVVLATGTALETARDTDFKSLQKCSTEGLNP